MRRPTDGLSGDPRTRERHAGRCRRASTRHLARATARLSWAQDGSVRSVPARFADIGHAGAPRGVEADVLGVGPGPGLGGSYRVRLKFRGRCPGGFLAAVLFGARARGRARSWAC